MSLLSLTLVLAFTMPTAATPLATSVVLTMKAEYFRDGEWVSEPGENMEASGAWFRANLVESVSARTHACSRRACMRKHSRTTRSRLRLRSHHYNDSTRHNSTRAQGNHFFCILEVR
jgi:hypothetical protein